MQFVLPAFAGVGLLTGNQLSTSLIKRTANRYFFLAMLVLSELLSSPGSQDGNNEENLTARQCSLRVQGHYPTRHNPTRSRTAPSQEGRIR
jgi:hypothetical protein